MATDPINGASSNGLVPEGTGRALKEVNMDDFLKLMIAELRNQDPLNPMDNSQILEQISQIRAVEASTKMTTTLEAVLAGQNLANAGTLINKNIAGLSEEGELITGRVESVLLQDGKPRLVLPDGVVSIKNIMTILPDE